MKLYRLAFLLVALLPVVQLHAQTANKTKSMDSLLIAYHKLGRFTGTALITKGGKTVYQKSYGYKNTARKTKDDANTIYQIGSVTKTFTSTMILLLQEQEKLNVKDKLSKYFPTFPDGDKITIEHLLTHTSGIYNYTEDTLFERSGMMKHQSREDMIALFKDKMPANAPGEAFSYSNSNYMLLGYIIEDLTGKTYHQALRDMILKPLGMKNTGTNFAGLQSPNKATGYFAIDGEKGAVAPVVDSSVSYAAGAIYSTVGDLDKWAQAVMAQKLLRPVDWIMATKPNKENYGYGWMSGDIYGKKSLGHNGGIHGFLSNLFMIPQDSVAIILLSNNMTSDLGTIRRDLAAILYEKAYEIPEVKVEIKLPAATLKEYIGVYQLAPTFEIKVFMDGEKLMAQATNQNPFQLFAERKDFFFLKVVDAQIGFIRDENNQIIKLMLHQGGRVLPGLKK